MTMFKYTLAILLLLGPDACPQILTGYKTPPATVVLDDVRPSPIALSADSATTTSIYLSWVSPGDDSLIGTASSYDLRYSTRELDIGNRVSNGTFTANTAGWSVLDGPAVISLDSSIYHNATASLRLVNGGADYAGAYSEITTTSRDYAFVSMWVYSDKSKDFDAWVLNQSNAVIGSFEHLFIPAKTWTLVQFNRELPGTQTAIRVGMNWILGAVGDTLWVDDVDVRIGISWDLYTSVTGEPTPSVSGTTEHYTLSGLTALTGYFMAIRSSDEVPNVSGNSNVLYQVTDALPDTAGDVEDSLTVGDYYVAVDGDDDDAGTLAAPFQTIAHALSVSGPGDTILVRSGTYHECLEPSVSGTSDAWIVLARYGTEAVTVDGDVANRIAVIGVGWNTDVNTERTAVDYLRIQGLNINYRYEQSLANSSNLFGVVIGGSGTSNITVNGCTFTSATDSGEGRSKDWKHYAVCILSASQVTISNNTFSGVYGGGWKFGIYFGNMVPPGRQIYDGNTITAWGSAINIGELLDYADSTVDMESKIVNNTLYDIWEEDGVQWESGYTKPAYLGILSVHNGWFVGNNLVYNCAENFFDIKGERWVIIDGNRCYNAKGDNNGVWDGNNQDGGTGLIANPTNSKYLGIWRFNELASACGGTAPHVPLMFYHNTMVNNNRNYAGPRSFTGGRGMEWGQGSSGYIIRYPSVPTGMGINNISVENKSSTTQGGGAFVWANSDTLELDYNLYYDSTGTVKNTTLYTTLGEANTKAEWLAAVKANPPYNVTKGDSNSIWADPQFATAPFNTTTLQSFDLQAGSPAVGAARAISFATNSGTNATSLQVQHPRAFFAGWTSISQPGDTILIGSGSTPYAVTAVNRDTRMLTISPAASWNSGDGIWLQRNGIKVNDIGARQQ